MAPRKPPKTSRKRWMDKKKKPRDKERERESHKATGAAQRGEGVPRIKPQALLTEFQFSWR